MYLGTFCTKIVPVNTFTLNVSLSVQGHSSCLTDQSETCYKDFFHMKSNIQCFILISQSGHDLKLGENKIKV